MERERKVRRRRRRRKMKILTKQSQSPCLSVHQTGHFSPRWSRSTHRSPQFSSSARWAETDGRAPSAAPHAASLPLRSRTRSGRVASPTSETCLSKLRQRLLPLAAHNASTLFILRTAGAWWWVTPHVVTSQQDVTHVHSTGSCRDH